MTEINNNRIETPTAEARKNIPVKNQGENLNHKDFRYGDPDKDSSFNELKEALKNNE